MKTNRTIVVPRPGWDVLRVLTSKVRTVTDVQLQRTDSRWSRKLMAELVRIGLLSEVRLSLSAPAARRVPFAAWRPGDHCPDCGSIAWQGRQRIRNTATQRARVYWATKRASNLVGGIGGKLRQPWQLQHDLGVTSVYLHLCREAPEAASRWISEDVYRREFGQKRGDKVADGFVVTDSGSLQKVIEFVGDYSASHLRAFHEFWSRRRIPYELR